MELIILWFIMTSGSGYIEPMNLKPEELRCGLPGIVVGVQVDRLEDPTTVRWIDPKSGDHHCAIDVAARVALMPMGEYHFATTIVSKINGDPYLSPDPHTSRMWMRSGHAPLPPPTTPEAITIVQLQVQIAELQIRLTSTEAQVKTLITQQALIRQEIEAAFKRLLALFP